MDAKDLSLSQLISRTTLRFARRIGDTEGSDLARINAALIVLGQAQSLVSVDNKMAKRLLEKAKEIS